MLATQLIRPIALAATLTAQLAPIASASGLGEPSPPIALAASGHASTTRPLSIVVSRASEGTMAPQDFCQALQKNDRTALKAVIDPELAKLNASGDEDRNFQTFKEWLERHDCVAKVEIDRDVLRSDPPIKQFHVTVRMNASGATVKRDIGVRLAPKRYEFDKK